MTMHATPVTRSTSRAGFLFQPLRALIVTLGAWQQRRRRRADLALLMSMEPHMLNDIGVTLTEQRGTSGRLRWHPAVLATTFQGRPHPPESEA